MGIVIRGIVVDRAPSAEKLQQLGIRSWPIWEKERSTFDWTYDEEETCYFLEGEVRVEPVGSTHEPVEIGQGDLVTFPRGLTCVWHVRKPVRKHYRFG